LARYRRARGILVDSKFSRAELLACGGIAPERVTVVYPGVSPDLFALERRPAERPYVLVVGTVEPRKDLATAIRALAAVPELRLVSVGPFTPYRDECERIALAAGVDGRVELRGYVSRAALLALYAGATFVAMPSRYEGFGWPRAKRAKRGPPPLGPRRSRASLGRRARVRSWLPTRACWRGTSTRENLVRRAVRYRRRAPRSSVTDRTNRLRASSQSRCARSRPAESYTAGAYSG
jgi:hypothetical protein